MGAVPKNLHNQDNTAASNSFFLSDGEKMLFLFVLRSNEMPTTLRPYCARWLWLRSETLADYQAEFQGAYINRLNARLSETNDSRYVGAIQDARQRANDWRAPKRYSEDIVPTRINWLIDLQLISVGSNRGRAATYNLTTAGEAFRKCIMTGHEYDDPVDDWHQSAFIHACTRSCRPRFANGTQLMKTSACNM